MGWLVGQGLGLGGGIWVGLGWAVGLGTVGDSLFGTGWGSSGCRLTRSCAAVLRPKGWYLEKQFIVILRTLSGPSGEVVLFLALSCPSCSRFCFSLLVLSHPGGPCGGVLAAALSHAGQVAGGPLAL